MAVMQTPHGRVIGLILPAEDQPKVEAVEKKEAPLSQATPASSPPHGGEPSKTTTAKRAGRTAKK